ncbi:hypothetical protein DSC45_32990 [Streptomyces sp. YIM 130001]|uniref:DUF2470 domain-containing protein n=1 Tax=Streptomyces sp. YIM 130001 TaxID=2259644 RepID=UPI000E654297|nr:DUF2470 domain-containing protein [Streptomyces sp. YIM 130001]RII08664.1 hypothetical protein DSC45_32990 [Streptomyces sp. YIM 130001]
MRTLTARVKQPTPAERVHSILSAAQSMTVITDGTHRAVHRLDNSGAMGHIHLHPPLDEPSVHTAAHSRTPVRLEFTDIAPTSVRDRIRARLTVTGLLCEPYADDEPEGTCMEFGQAMLRDAEGRHFVTLDDLSRTAPDPLAAHESVMLTHLLDSHRELIPLLVRLVRPRPSKGMLRAIPLAMDRYGLTLRLEYPEAHADVRLPFATQVRSAEEAGPRIRGLLAAARRASHRNHLGA